MEDGVHIPFLQSGERECMKKYSKANSPGPGQYIDINNPHHSSVCRTLLKFSSDRGFAEAHGIKIGPFGSNSKRFTGGYFAGKQGPGPGFYEAVKRDDKGVPPLTGA
jgi:hypothetical protein